VRGLMRAAIWPMVFLAVNAVQAYEPKVNYMLNCMGCHTENGAGAPGKVPSMRATLVPLAQRAAGRRFLVQVPGMAQSPLSNREVAELLNWMLRNLSARARPAGVADFTAAEVASYRGQRLKDVAGTRARLLATLQ
jgi:mono/diheme cytochrome c family protein